MVTKALVVGSGCIGLRTALELLRKEIKVIIRSTNPPLHSSTCSQGAGGLWMPFHCDDERVNRWSKESLTELLDIESKLKSASTSTSTSTSTSKSSGLIEIMPAISLHKENHLHPTEKSSALLPEWTMDERLKFQAMSLEMFAWQNQLYKLRIPDIDQLQEDGYLYNWFFFTPVVNPPRMLQVRRLEIHYIQHIVLIIYIHSNRMKEILHFV